MRAHIASVVTGTASVVLFTTSILAAPVARLSADDITVVSAGENKWSVLKGTAIIATWSK